MTTASGEVLVSTRSQWILVDPGEPEDPPALQLHRSGVPPGEFTFGLPGVR